MIILHKSRNKRSGNNSEELGSSGFRGEEAVLFANLSFASDRFSSLSEELLHFTWEQKTAGNCSQISLTCICSTAC